MSNSNNVGTWLPENGKGKPGRPRKSWKGLRQSTCTILRRRGTTLCHLQSVLYKILFSSVFNIQDRMLSYIFKILFETILTKMQIHFEHTFSNIRFYSNNLFMPINLFLSYFCASAKPVLPETSDTG